MLKFFEGYSYSIIFLLCHNYGHMPNNYGLYKLVTIKILQNLLLPTVRSQTGWMDGRLDGQVEGVE